MGSVLQLVQWTAQFWWNHDNQRSLGLSMEALKSGLYTVINLVQYFVAKLVTGVEAVYVDHQHKKKSHEHNEPPAS